MNDSAKQFTKGLSLRTIESLTIPCIIFLNERYDNQSQTELEHDSTKIRMREKIVFGNHWLRNYSIDEWISIGLDQEDKYRHLRFSELAYRKSWTKRYTVDEWVSIGRDINICRDKNGSLPDATHQQCDPKRDEKKENAGDPVGRPQHNCGRVVRASNCGRVVRASDGRLSPAPKWIDGVYKPDDLIDEDNDHDDDQQRTGAERIVHDPKVYRGKQAHEERKLLSDRELDPTGDWTGRVFKINHPKNRHDEIANACHRATVWANDRDGLHENFGIDEDPKEAGITLNNNLGSTHNRDLTGGSNKNNKNNKNKNNNNKNNKNTKRLFVEPSATKKRRPKKQRRKTAPWGNGNPSETDRRRSA